GGHRVDGHSVHSCRRHAPDRRVLCVACARRARAERDCGRFRGGSRPDPRHRAATPHPDAATVPRNAGGRRCLRARRRAAVAAALGDPRADLRCDRRRVARGARDEAGGSPMSTSVIAEIAIRFSALSLVAIGGINAILPEIHRVVVDVEGWMTSAEFAELFALAQLAPGPNAMIVALIGWKLAGV